MRTTWAGFSVGGAAAPSSKIIELEQAVVAVATVGMWATRQRCPSAASYPRVPAHSFETHAYARETGIMYGDNRADERAARRLRQASETAAKFAFFLTDERETPGRRWQAHCGRALGVLANPLASCLGDRKAASRRSRISLKDWCFLATRECRPG